MNSNTESGQVNQKRFQAKNLDAALALAQKFWNVPGDQIEYKIVSQTNAGILSIFGFNKIEIDAWRNKNVKQNFRRKHQKFERKPQQVEERQATQQTAAPTPRPELTEEEKNTLISDLSTFASSLCKYLINEDVETEAKLEEERLVINLKNDQMATLLQNNSKLVESLEHLIRKKPRYLKRDLPFRIFVDAQGKRVEREAELVEMAKDLSAKVVEKQRPIVLNYKSAYDRRIIHMTLDKDDRVYTKSVGSGSNRKLMILPTKDGKTPKQNEQRSS